MKSMIRKIFMICVVLLPFFVINAYAGNDKNGLYDERAYVSPMFSYWRLDTDRKADNDEGIGGKLAFGHALNDKYLFEFEINYDQFDHALGKNTDQFGGGFNLLRHFSNEGGLDPYLLIGAGALNTDSNFSINRNTPYANAGLGLFINSMLRFDIRGRVDIGSTDFNSNSTFIDFSANLGLFIPLGKKVLPDTDMDGIPDAEDRCPNTVAGADVDLKGCELDDDNDGVANGQDRCPSTPAGVKVTSEGCESDGDSDGVVDSQDRCPNTSAGTEVNSEGCAMDDDGDGVMNSLDRCPNTLTGLNVDSQGCELDTDGDGILDSLDRCANTPLGVKTDEQGCQLKEVITLSGVKFQTNSIKLADSSENKALMDATQTLLRYPDMAVVIVGYTDSRGSAVYNKRLSLKRAMAVKNYMISQGVKAENLTAEGKGEADPIADNMYAPGRAKNRRVELHIIQ